MMIKEVTAHPPALPPSFLLTHNFTKKEGKIWRKNWIYKNTPEKSK